MSLESTATRLDVERPVQLSSIPALAALEITASSLPPRMCAGVPVTAVKSSSTITLVRAPLSLSATYKSCTSVRAHFFSAGCVSP